MREGLATWLNALAASVSAIAAVSIAVTTGQLADFFSRETIQVLPLDQIVLFEDSTTRAGLPVVSLEFGIFNNGAGSNAITEQHVEIEAGWRRLACFEGRAYADIRLYGSPGAVAPRSEADCEEAQECITLPTATIAVRTDPWVIGVPASSVASDRAIFGRDACPDGAGSQSLTFENLISEMTEQPVNVLYNVHARGGVHRTVCAVELTEGLARTALRDRFVVLACDEGAARARPA